MNRKYEGSSVLFVSGLVMMSIAIMIATIGGILQNIYMTIVGIGLVIIGNILYFYSNEARVNLENKLKRRFNEKTRIVTVLACMVIAVILFFLLTPIKAALLFSSIVLFCGSMGILLGIYLNKR